MDQLVYIDSLKDNIFVSSPLTIKEAIAVVFVRDKKHTAWFNNYVLKRWLLGYESVLTKNSIPEKNRNILLPVTGEYSYTEFELLISKIKTISQTHTLLEQERIWKWVHLHQKSK